jgi:hypothetical protein
LVITQAFSSVNGVTVNSTPSFPLTGIQRRSPEEYLPMIGCDMGIAAGDMLVFQLTVV